MVKIWAECGEHVIYNCDSRKTKRDESIEEYMCIYEDVVRDVGEVKTQLGAGSGTVRVNKRVNKTDGGEKRGLQFSVGGGDDAVGRGAGGP